MSVRTSGAQKALGIGLAMLCLQRCMLILKSTGVKSRHSINYSFQRTRGHWCTPLKAPVRAKYRALFMRSHA